MEVINLTPYYFEKETLDVLKFGLSFCPSTNIDKYETIKDVYLFSRNLTYKFLFDKQVLQSKQDKAITEQVKHFSMEDFRVLRDLILLLEEN